MWKHKDLQDITNQVAIAMGYSKRINTITDKNVNYFLLLMEEKNMVATMLEIDSEDTYAFVFEDNNIGPTICYHRGVMAELDIDEVVKVAMHEVLHLITGRHDDDMFFQLAQVINGL